MELFICEKCASIAEKNKPYVDTNKFVMYCVDSDNNHYKSAHMHYMPPECYCYRCGFCGYDFLLMDIVIKIEFFFIKQSLIKLSRKY